MDELDRPGELPRVLLVTCREHPDGEPGHEALDDALMVRGIDASWVAWDDEDVDWRRADLVAVRSAWDYMGRLEEFLAWAERIDRVVLHGPRVFRWNTDKRYVLDLERAGVPVVPTWLVTTEADARALLRAAGSWVVKPTVGANGLGVTAVDGVGWVPVSPGPWLVQPLVESIRTEGEISVFVIDGGVVAQVVKTPAAGDFRVHEELGGRARPARLTDEAAAVARHAYAVTERLVGTRLSYARVDLLRHEGQLVVTEVEITEPGLYLDVMPEIAEPFADAISRLAAQRAMP